MQMLGNAELLTVAKYWESWADPRLIVLVLNNADLNFVTWEQRATHGDAKFVASQDLPQFPYARYAELLGLHGLRVDDPDEVGPTWAAGLRGSAPGRARGGRQPRRAAAAAAHHLQAGRVDDEGPAQGRPRCRRRRAREHARAACPIGAGGRRPRPPEPPSRRRAAGLVSGGQRVPGGRSAAVQRRIPRYVVSRRRVVPGLDPLPRARACGAGAARGRAVGGIRLWVFGGVGELRGETPSAGAEFRIAAAGPSS